MAGKRSRSALSPTSSGADILEIEAPQTKSSVCFTLQTDEQPAQRRTLGEFLQTCRWCGKQIEDTSPVYMYGDLGAFCKPECREVRIELDRRILAKRNSKLGEFLKRLELAKEK